MEKLWAWGWFRTTIVGHVIRSLILITCFYNRGDQSRGTGEDAHQNDGTKPPRRPIWTKLKLYLPLKNRFHVAVMMSIGYSSSVIWILPKNLICPSGKLRIEITNPIAKSTNPGISDTTFFARCQKFILRRLKRPVAIQAKLAFLLLTQEDKKKAMLRQGASITAFLLLLLPSLSPPFLIFWRAVVSDTSRGQNIGVSWTS